MYGREWQKKTFDFYDDSILAIHFSFPFRYAAFLCSVVCQIINT